MNSKSVIEWNLKDELAIIRKHYGNNPERQVVSKQITLRFQDYLNTLGKYLGIKFNHMPVENHIYSTWRALSEGITQFSGLFSNKSIEARINLREYSNTLANEVSHFELELSFPQEMDLSKTKQCITDLIEIPLESPTIYTGGIDRSTGLSESISLSFEYDERVQRLNKIERFNADLFGNLPLYLALGKLKERFRHR